MYINQKSYHVILNYTRLKRAKAYSPQMIARDIGTILVIGYLQALKVELPLIAADRSNRCEKVSRVETIECEL